MSVWLPEEEIREELRAIRRSLHRIEADQRILMTLVSVDDSVVATIGTELATILSGVEAIVADEANPLQPADFSSITDSITKLQSALASPETPVASDPAPADPAPVEDPAPTDDGDATPTA